MANKIAIGGLLTGLGKGVEKIGDIMTYRFEILEQRRKEAEKQQQLEERAADQEREVQATIGRLNHYFEQRNDADKLLQGTANIDGSLVGTNVQMGGVDESGLWPEATPVNVAMDVGKLGQEVPAAVKTDIYGKIFPEEEVPTADLTYSQFLDRYNKLKPGERKPFEDKYKDFGYRGYLYKEKEGQKNADKGAKEMEKLWKTQRKMVDEEIRRAEARVKDFEYKQKAFMKRKANQEQMGIEGTLEDFNLGNYSSNFISYANDKKYLERLKDIDRQLSVNVGVPVRKDYLPSIMNNYNKIRKNKIIGTGQQEKGLKIGDTLEGSRIINIGTAGDKTYYKLEDGRTITK